MPETVIDNERAFELLDTLQQRIVEIFGFYFDCKRALPEMANNLQVLQQSILQGNSLMPGSAGGAPKTVADMDKVPFIYGNGDPSDPASVALHNVSQGDLKKRNLPGGKNHAILSHSVISILYSLWNDEFRPKIAHAIGIKIKELSSDVFGDIRYIRNSIIHHDGTALPEIDNCKPPPSR